jgi:recombination protein RecA
MAKKQKEVATSLEEVLANIEKKYGKGTIMLLEGKSDENIQTISTGSLSLDSATGIGGVPKGRIIEIFGPESSGKTTLALHIVAEVQKNGGKAAYIDAEHALDPRYAHNIGVDFSKLYISQPDCGEQALEIVDSLVRSGSIDVIVVDSVAALVPTAEINGEMGDSNVGVMARLMSQAMRKLTASIAKTNTCVIFINQLREKIGIMFGNPETTTGGRALKFYSSMRFDIRRIAAIKSGERVVGNRTKVKVVKNKLAPPFRDCEFDIMYGVGISRGSELLDAGLESGKLTQRGSWFVFDGKNIAQGRENLINLINSDEELRGKLQKNLPDNLLAATAHATDKA